MGIWLRMKKLNAWGALLRRIVYNFCHLGWLKVSLSLLSLIFLLLLIINGCSFIGKDQVEIRFWNGFTGPDGRTIRTMVEQFNKENPDVHVVLQRMPWSNYYSKLFVAGIGHRAPEVFVIHTENMPRFVLAGFLLPLNDLFEINPDFDINDFDQNVINNVVFHNRTYAIPLDTHMIGMYYNMKLFREAGIVDEQGEPIPPKNREEFLDALNKLTKDLDGDGIPDQWGFVMPWQRMVVYSIIRQWGGRLLSENGSQCLMNSPENIEALQFCVDLIRKYRVVPPPESFDAWIGFRQGRVGIAFEGPWMIPELEKQHDLDYGGTIAPMLGDYQRSEMGGSHNLCLRSDLQGKRLDAAWRFVCYLSDHSLLWAKEGGQLPVRKSLRNSSDFKKMKIQSEFAKQIPELVTLPQTTSSFEVWAEFDVAVERALRGTMPVKESLDLATAKVEEVLERHRKIYGEAVSELN